MEFQVFLHVFAGLFVAVSALAPDTLRIVNALYRHGDRSPVTVYPKDPHQAEEWPQGLGWLSETGMRQHYALGQYLRSEYNNLLSAEYKRTEILVQSSNEDRCLMSAYCDLAGLYPPSGDQLWNPNITWQPIPVHTRPQEYDRKLNMGAPCPRYDELYDIELQSPAVKAEEKDNKDFYDFIEKKTGVKKENISEVWKIGDTLFCEKMHNKTMPDWVNDTIYTKLRNLQAWSFDLLYNGTELSRLKGGPLLQEFIYNMQQAAAGNVTYKMFMYSAHDSTVAAVSQAMQVFNQKSPPYAAALLVELHQMSDGYKVRLRYRNDTQQDPYPLYHPACPQDTEYCPLDTFVKGTKDRVPEDWAAECHVVTDDEVADVIAGTVLALMVVIMILCALLIITAIA
ncbi:hypothetical protein BaRGS_00039229, partial [Batillaria attramentaria]